ncbi:putative peptidase family-domain-containing protein [Kickxella alabastrina]|uniref:putative peptidase family-domain-containing protein n=1 Tax=Kickxella alabastrina TaxID=61397 RepID=UPI00221ED920|nr:putative peptidase family-domain-containing protein [Kickxella alabastrina]KAI7825909.1 putative peptidase family-domain-containing protein [Kickxella alabastrina]KAJ1947240.1 hypothetical protein GGF37_000542 [Kickxella alabastrina]
MEYFEKIKAKFERLSTSGNDRPGNASSSSAGKHQASNQPYPGAGSQSKHHYSQKQQQQESPYSQLPPDRAFPTAQHQPNNNYEQGLGPGGFFAPPPPPPSRMQFPFGGDAGRYGGPNSPFPGQAAYPPYPPQGQSQGPYLPQGQDQAPYPPSTQSTYPPQDQGQGHALYPPKNDSSYPPSFAQAPYPPVGAPQQGPPGTGEHPSKLPGADKVEPTKTQDGQGAPRGDDGTGNGLHTLAPSEIPPDVRLPVEQGNVYPSAADSQRMHGATLAGAVSGASASSSSGKQMEFLNITNNEMVHQRFLIVCGQVPGVKGDQDKIVVHHPYFPPLTFPAIDGYFKVLVELESGENSLKFDYLQGDDRLSQGELSIKMTPYMDKPPLRLAILVGSDSKGIFDAPPDARGPGVNDLDAAVRKFRCCAYLWQAYISEQLYRNGFGRRTFRLEETYEPDTMARDNMRRMTARVHVVRSKYTVAEIQDKERAQQWKEPHGYKRHTDESQFSVAIDAIKGYDDIPKGDGCYVACLTADSRWDPELGVILGHAALGGGTSDLRLGVFGSHTTHSWPANAEEVATKFLDTTKTDTRYLANDCNECGEYWRSANIGMGAFLHECGHLLTLAHTPSGIMSRGFNDYNRTFMAHAPNFKGPVKQQDEAGSHWHRTDIIRLRHHPCLRLPTDPPLRENERAESGFNLLPVENGLTVQNTNGITMIEVWVNNKYRNHREYTAENLDSRRSGQIPAGPDEMAAEFPQSILVDISTWREWAGGWSNSDKIHLVLTSRATATDQTDSDITIIKGSSRKDGNGNTVFSAGQLGKGQMGGSEKFEAWFTSNAAHSSELKLRSIEIRSGNYIDGVIFHMTNGSQQQVGKCQGGGTHILHIDNDDDLDYVLVNSGWWIDGLEFVTRNGKRSGWKGGKGGSTHVLKPPTGYSWAGLSGSGAGWLDSLTMHYSKSR